MKIIMDTDIGTDVDDALALGVLLGSPEIELLGITTVYGDVVLRGQLASRLLQISGSKANIPVMAGTSQTRSGRPVWWPGHEGKLHHDLPSEAISEVDAVDFLVDSAQTMPGVVDVLALGPLTNIAAALDQDQNFGKNIRRVVIMGGDFGQASKEIEHNFKSDVAAAQRVFTSDLNIVVGGLDLTTQVKFDIADVDRIAASGALGEALRREISAWWEFHGHAWNNPHDPILALWLTRPDLFSSRVGEVVVNDDGSTDDRYYPEGDVRIVHGLQAEAVSQELVARISAASRLPFEN